MLGNLVKDDYLINETSSHLVFLLKQEHKAKKNSSEECHASSCGKMKFGFVMAEWASEFFQYF